MKKEKKIKAYWYNTENTNVGDMLTPVIIKALTGYEVEWVNKDYSPKLIAVGSIIAFALNDDIIWGAGFIDENEKINLTNNYNYLAVRGKLTAKKLGINCAAYGDPAILLPLIYDPEVEVKYKYGIVEHYVDKGLYKGEGKRINVLQTWRAFINEIKECETIISSSLHGCIIAEAYGIPVKWITLSDKVVGNGFKFRDYLSATDRTAFNQPFNLKEQQQNLLKALRNYYG